MDDWMVAAVMIIDRSNISPDFIDILISMKLFKSANNYEHH